MARDPRNGPANDRLQGQHGRGCRPGAGASRNGEPRGRDHRPDAARAHGWLGPSERAADARADAARDLLHRVSGLPVRDGRSGRCWLYEQGRRPSRPLRPAACRDPALPRAPGERNDLDDYHQKLYQSTQPHAPDAIASVATTPSAKAPRTTLICHVIEIHPLEIPEITRPGVSMLRDSRI